MNILYAVSEAYPFAKTCGLGDVALAYPQAVRKQGEDIRVIMPLYDSFMDAYMDQMELMVSFPINLSYREYLCGLYRLDLDDLTFYFLENIQFFERGRLYGCADDDARFAFFSRAVCESLSYMDWSPDVIHCNDWQTALIPIYLQDVAARHPERAKIHTVFTIHNVEQQGKFSYQALTDVFGLAGSLFAEGTFEMDGNVNLMKGALRTADAVTTVSPTYAEELLANPSLQEMFEGLEPIGIRNGIHDLLNPTDAEFIHCPYSADDMSGRLENKQHMQQTHHFATGSEIPAFGVVSRLLPRKGFELILQVMPEFLEKGAQLLITGDGDEEIRTGLERLMVAFPGQVAMLPFSEKASVEVFSSCDIFLMPSMVEPCGTSQLQAMNYGMLPVVHMTGGLKDTVVPYDPATGEGYGFGFEDYTADAFRAAVEDALRVYLDPAHRAELQQRCMRRDFSWEEPAKEYLALYRRLIG